MTRTVFLVFAATAVAAAATLGTANGAQADPVPTITVSPSHVAAGALIVVRGDGCVSPDDAPGQPVAAVATFDPNDATGGAGDVTQPSPDGDWSITLRVPPGTASGSHTVEAACEAYDGEELDYPAVHVTVTGTATSTAGAATASPSTIAVGGLVTVRGAGFAAGERVAVTLHSKAVDLGTVTATSGGVASASVRIPAGTAPGAHDIVLTGATSGRVDTVAITVTTAGASGELPFSGMPTTELVTSGGVLVAAGSALVAAAARTRRRRRPQH